MGRVVEVRPHPNADRLKLATVDLGNEALTVVCGAPNVAEEQKVAFARVGAKLIDPRTGERSVLTAATVRGVVSEGMACSERELGLGDDHAGIVELPQDAPVGQPLADYLPSDDLFELEVTPNRGDWLSVLGVAHEVAALTGAVVTEPSLEYPEEGPEVGELATIRIEDPEMCGRYTATVVQGLRVGPFATVDAAAAHGSGAASHQQRGGCHQLRDAGVRPAPPRLRPVEGPPVHRGGPGSARGGAALGLG